MKISYSALDTFQSCPQKYKFQEVDRIRVPRSKEAVFGTLVHQALKFLYSQEPVVPTLEEALQYFRDQWPLDAARGKPLDGSAAQTLWASEAEEAAYKAEGERMIAEYYRGAFPHSSRTVAVETPFEAPIADPASGEAHLLKGKIDRIDKHSDGTFEIVDYKTSRRMPAQSSVDDDLQLSLYQLGLVERWPNLKIPKVKLTLHFLRHGLAVSTSRTEAKIQETKAEVVRLINEIKKSDFRPMPGPLCDWCGYKPICPMWRHLYEKDRAEMNPETVREKLKEFFAHKKTAAESDTQLAALRKEIESYLDAKGLDRIFGDEGQITRTKIVRSTYDLAKLKEILEPLGKWETVLAVDSAKLKQLMSELPSPIRKKIEAAKVVKSESTSIQATRAKVKPPLLSAIDRKIA
ncbi:PD-(D/E)XK nuclease family protein [Candidatus Parcubacteria bacterium]|nr:PD-(D/E)XK nuclease family protein [Candidatus Parcubacteria bacterium]